MSASDPEVVVSHVSDLSSSKKPILFQSFLFLQADLLFLKWEFLMIVFNAEAILESSSSKFGKFLPAVDREDFNSSIESTICTSLTHNIASEGKSEQELTSVLKLNFQKINDMSGEFLKLKLRYLQSLLPNHRTLWNIHQQKGVHGRRPSFRHRHCSRAPNTFFTSCDKCPCTSLHWNRTCSTWSRGVKNSLIRCL